jgi:hypothetical protein
MHLQMALTRGWKYILTVVDIRSMKARRHKTAINVRNALINIVAETKTYPRIVQVTRNGIFWGETRIIPNNIT